MNDGPHIIGVAALLGDHARAAVLTVLMSGMALSATELADAAGVTRQTISGHLAKLVDAGLLTVAAQGRHRYFRLANADVAQLLESLMGVAWRSGPPRLRGGPREPALRKARVCYDHLAGELAVFMYEQLARRAVFALDADGIALTGDGERIVRELGLDLDALRATKRRFCRSCLDWSERRDHLAGALGGALLAHIEARGWASRVRDSRALAFSAAGEAALRSWLAA